MLHSRRNHSRSSPTSNQLNNTTTSALTAAAGNDTELERPRKRTRCLRSCLACRKAKQRCQLPDSFVEPSNMPLPSHLACRRCLVLENDCFVVDGVPRASPSTLRTQQNQERPFLQPLSHRIRCPPGSTSIASFQDELADPDYLDTGKRNQDELQDAQRERDNNRTSECRSSGTPPPVNDLRLFDPEAEEEGKRTTNQIQQSASTIIAHPAKKTTGAWIKVGMTVCRPFELLGYLLRKQSISRHLFLHGSRPVVILMNLIASIPDLEERYEIELNALQTNLPFLPPFDELWQIGKDAEFLLGVMLYLSFKTRQEEDSQCQILPILRQHSLSCVIHQPRNIYDIISLILIALHLPLLLGALSDENSLDGAGLLTSAASASRSLDLDKSFSHLHSSAIGDINSKNLQNASLYVSLGLHTGFVALAGDVERQPIVKCFIDDYDALQSYVSSLCALPSITLPAKRKCASILLMIYRARATDEIRQVCQKYANLMKNHQEELDRAGNIVQFQKLFDESKDALQSCCDALKHHHYPLAKSLASFFGWQQSYCIDVLSLDMALLQFVCLSRFTEKLFERSPRLIGHDASPIDLLTLLEIDQPLQLLYSSVGCHRADIARHVLALLMNTIRHASNQSNQVVAPFLLIKSIATTHLCSSLFMAGQAITEEMDGRITAGKSPSKKIGDATMEITEVLLQGTMQALIQLGGLSESLQSVVRQAAHQGNLYILSARLVDSLARRLTGWKGDRSSHHNNHTTTTRHVFPRKGVQGDTMGVEDTQFDLEGFSPDSFEDLFREILSTPIQFV